MNYKQMANNLAEQFRAALSQDLRATPNMQVMIHVRSDLSAYFSEKIANKIVSRMQISICQSAWDEAASEILEAASVTCQLLAKVFDVLEDEVGTEAANKMIVTMSNQFYLKFE